MPDSGGRGPVNVSAPPDDAIAAADGGRPVGEDESRMIVEAPFAPLSRLPLEARPAVGSVRARWEIYCCGSVEALPGLRCLPSLSKRSPRALNRLPSRVVVRSRLGELISDVAFLVFGSRERTILLFDANPGISDWLYRPRLAGSAPVITRPVGLGPPDADVVELGGVVEGADADAAVGEGRVVGGHDGVSMSSK